MKYFIPIKGQAWSILKGQCFCSLLQQEWMAKAIIRLCYMHILVHTATLAIFKIGHQNRRAFGQACAEHLFSHKIVSLSYSRPSQLTAACQEQVKHSETDMKRVLVKVYGSVVNEWL